MVSEDARTLEVDDSRFLEVLAGFGPFFALTAAAFDPHVSVDPPPHRHAFDHESDERCDASPST